MDYKEFYDWEDISLEKAIKIVSYKPIDKPQLFENEVNILSIIFDKPIDHFEEMSPNSIIELYNKFTFLSKLPEVSDKYPTKLKIKGYGHVRLTPFNELSLGQMVDIEEMVKDGMIKNYHKILAILYVPVKFNLFKFKWEFLEDTTFKERSDKFLNLDFQTFYSVIHFFLSLGNRYTKILADSLMEENKKVMMNEIQTLTEERPLKK